MKGDDDKKQPSSPAAAAAAVVAMDSSMGQKVVETASMKPTSSMKRKADDENEEEDEPTKKLKSEEFPTPALEPPQPESEPPTETPTEISHITVPPVETLGGRKVGANYMLPMPPTALHSTLDIFPKDEDILFGRGGRTNHHPGNKRLREIVEKYRHIYNVRTHNIRWYPLFVPIRFQSF